MNTNTATPAPSLRCTDVRTIRDAIATLQAAGLDVKHISLASGFKLTPVGPGIRVDLDD